MSYIEYVHVRPRSENLLLGLARAIQFTAASLLANRQGKLHPEQFKRFASRRVTTPLTAGIASLFAPVMIRLSWTVLFEERSIGRFLLAVAGDPTALARLLRGGIEEPIPDLVLVMALVFPLMTLHYLMKTPWATVLDLLLRKVKKESGLLSARWDERRLRGKGGREGDLVSSYAYVLNGKSFRVDRAAFEAVVPSLDYNLYYLPNSNIVVSIEPKDVADKPFDPNSKGFELVRPTV